jgi:type I restriction enzyme, S subunit
MPPIDVTPEQWAIVQRILQDHVPDHEVRAFGSRATWTAKPYSDLDLMIMSAQPLPPSVIAALREAFTESDLPWKVDVLESVSVPESWRAAAEREAVPLYGGVLWPAVALRQLVDPSRGITYGVVQPGPHVPDGVPIVRVKDVRNGRIATRDPMRIDPAREATYARSRLQGGELLLTLVGTVGETAIVPAGLAGWNTARAVGVVPVNADVGPHWVQMAMQAPDVRQRIGARVNTTVQTTLNLRDVADLPIVLPPAEKRRAIERVGRSLDDRLTLNRGMTTTLEAMARALFRSWFVDFDPVRAKAEGKVTESPTELDRLFPGSFSATPAMLPNGWAMGRLADVAQIVMGQSPKSSYYNHVGVGLPFHQGVTNFGVHFPTHRTWCTELKRIAEPGDVLVSVRAPVGRINIANERVVIGRGLAAVRSAHGHQTFLWAALKEAFGDEDSLGHGTIYNAITRRDLHNLPVVRPPRALLDAYENHIAPAWDRINVLDAQARTLTEMRDALLPRLLSGEVRVPLDEPEHSG